MPSPLVTLALDFTNQLVAAAAQVVVVVNGVIAGVIPPSALEPVSVGLEASSEQAAALALLAVREADETGVAQPTLAQVIVEMDQAVLAAITSIVDKLLYGPYTVTPVAVEAQAFVNVFVAAAPELFAVIEGVIYGTVPPSALAAVSAALADFSEQAEALALLAVREQIENNYEAPTLAQVIVAGTQLILVSITNLVAKITPLES